MVKQNPLLEEHLQPGTLRHRPPVADPSKVEVLGPLVLQQQHPYANTNKSEKNLVDCLATAYQDPRCRLTVVP